jgi:hypothetical protein
VASVRASGYLSPSSLAPILGLLPPHSCRAGGGPVTEATVSTAVFFAPLARVRAKFRFAAKRCYEDLSSRCAGGPYQSGKH